MISAVASIAGSLPAQSDSPSIDTCGSVTSGHCGSPIVAAAPESRSMCSRSIGPASAGIGTTGTPAIKPATTPTTVSSVDVALNATAGMPSRRWATAPARRANRAHETAVPSTLSAALWSPRSPVSEGSSGLMLHPLAR